MKTKLSILLAVIIALSVVFTSCGEASTTSTQKTTNSSDDLGACKLFTFYYSFDELFEYIENPETNHSRDTELCQTIKENGKLYYGEMKFREYAVVGVKMTDIGITYTVMPKEAFTEDGVCTDELYYVYYDDEALISIHYRSSFEAQKAQLLKDDDFELLDNGSIYSERLKWLIFEYEGCAFQINLPKNYEGGLDWQDIVEIKYVEVNK